MSTIVRAWPACEDLGYPEGARRAELSVAKKIALAVGFAAFTGLAAQVRVPLGFTPVPVTGQVFAVLLSGVMLGPTYGGLSQFIYVGLGAAGLRWFEGLSGGLAALAGPTGGYLVGFVLAAELIGSLSDRFATARARAWLMIAGVALIYLCGAVWFSVVMHTGLAGTLLGAVLPFVPVDVAKAVAAACLSTALLPKTSYDGEADAAAHRRKP